jgi:hippurate hydrolase
VRKRLLSALERIVKAEAAAAGAPKEPEVKITEGTPATYNDPALSKRLAGAFARAFGASNVIEAQPVMGGEDFSEYGRAGVPAVIFWIGAAETAKFAAAKAAGESLPSLHSPLFAPDPEPTLKTGAAALTVAAMELLGKT